MALLAPTWSLLRTELDLPDSMTTAEMAADARVREYVVKEVMENTQDLASYEQIRRVALLPRDLTIEDEELSPTLKIKRRVVERRYADLIDAAYAEDIRARGAAR
jgi:long-chain acyl-CoA synthetase